MKKKEQIKKAFGYIAKISHSAVHIFTLLCAVASFLGIVNISTQLDEINHLQRVSNTLTRVVSVCSPDGSEQLQTLTLTSNDWVEFFETFSSEEVLGLKIENFEELFQTMRELSWDSRLNPFASSEINEFLEEANLEPSPTGFYALEKTDGVWQSSLCREGTDLHISHSYNNENKILTITFVNYSTFDLVEKDFMAINPPKVILSKDKNAQYIIFQSVEEGALYAINDIGSLFRLT